MRITLLAFGSQGDVRPILALAAGLRHAGHEVRLGTDRSFASMVSAAGVEFAPVAMDVAGMLPSKNEQGRPGTDSNPIRLVASFVRQVRPMVTRMLQDSWDACQDADALILGYVSFLPGRSIAQKLNIPYVQANTMPLTRTGVFASPIVPPTPIPLGAGYNRLTHALVGQAFWQPFRPLVNTWRRSFLGLPPASFWESPFRMAAGAPMLYGFSPSVVPPPPDWDESLHITGYWFLDSPPDWQPPEPLREFLAAGSPPVSVGFGSMPTRDPAATTDLIVRALALAGRRGVLLTGWGGLSAAHLPPTIYAAESIPHDWLFPRMAAVVHHGGAGTTAAGLRAGVPSVLVPFFLDQPFWARRVADLGVGPAPIPQRRLTVERLAATIRAATSDEAMRARADALGARIRAEDGVGRAVAVTEGHLAHVAAGR